MYKNPTKTTTNYIFNLKPAGEEVVILTELDAVKMHVHCIGCKLKDQRVHTNNVHPEGVRMKWDDPITYAMNMRSSCTKQGR